MRFSPNKSRDGSCARILDGCRVRDCNGERAAEVSHIGEPLTQRVAAPPLAELAHRKWSVRHL
jgi:hypothetical protein